MRSDTVIAIRTMLQIPNADTEIFDNDISDVLIDTAIKEFQRRRPRIVRADYLGNSQSNYHLPSAWEIDFSHVRAIYTDDQHTSLPIDANGYAVLRVDNTSRRVTTAISGATSLTVTTVANAAFYRDGDPVEIKNQNTDTPSQLNWVTANGNAATGAVTLLNALTQTFSSSPIIRKVNLLRFIDFLPSSVDFFSMEYTAPHTHDDTTNTILAHDYGAFVVLCSAITAEAIASKFSRSVEASLDADSIDFGTLAQQWSERAKMLRDSFEKQLGGVAAGETARAISAGGKFRDVDNRLSTGGRLLFHGGTNR